MKISFLTTFRNNDKYRLVNLERVISHISSEFPDWEIVVVEQDEESTLVSHPIVKNVNYLHVYNPGLFNKSWGMNVAFKQSSGDILVVSDADMIVQADDLQRAVSACKTELDAVRPYGMLVDMTEEQTEQYMQHGVLPGAPAKKRGYDRAHASESLCMAGGIYIITREFYTRTGGMDEHFSGWGGEDDAMSAKLLNMGERVAIARNAKAWHLWHPRERRYEHDGYVRNRRLLQQYGSMGKAEMLQLCRQQANNNGNAAKYRGVKQAASMAGQQYNAQDATSYVSQNFPENYGEIVLAGPADFDRKFGVVIPSCGRSEYLKQCLESLSKSDLSQAIICIVDETEAAKEVVEGFTCFEGIDYPEANIEHVDNDIDSMLYAVKQEQLCNLFNDFGWLKQEIKHPSRLQIMHSRHGLYVRNTYLDKNPAIADMLKELERKKDADAADLVREFSIKDVPVIKVYKHIHRNMFDSLRAGWDCLEEMGCEHLVNLDADAIVSKKWLSKLEATHELYKNEKSDSPFIVTGFNTSSHDTLTRTDDYVLKKTIGGINLFFNRSLYMELVRSVLRDIDWDHTLSARVSMVNGAMVATVPSVVQHIGESGLWAKPWDYDVSDDFNG